MDACRKGQPPMVDLGSQHFAACLRATEPVTAPDEA
jgi:hypothetical protein